MINDMCVCIFSEMRSSVNRRCLIACNHGNHQNEYLLKHGSICIQEKACRRCEQLEVELEKARREHKEMQVSVWST